MSKALAKTNGPVPTFADHVNAQVAAVAGFTEDNQFRVRFPREGKIHLGVKKLFEKTNSKGEKYTVESPTATDYFVLPDNLLADPLFMEVLAELNADPMKPTRLPIWLPSNQIPDNIDTSWNRYGKTRGLICRSRDGLTATCRDEQTGESKEIACANKDCPFAKPKADNKPADCGIIHRIRVMLPDASGIGIWQIDTKSPNNWGNLCCEMTNIKGMTGGKLAGLDLWLELVPEQKLVTYEYKGEIKSGLKTVYLLHIKTATKLRDLRKAAAAVVVDWEMSDVAEVDTEYDEVAHGAPDAPEEPDDFMAGIHGDEPEDAQFAEEPDGLCEELLDECRASLDSLFTNEVMRRSAISSALNCKPSESPAIEDCTIDQLTAIRERLRAIAESRSRAA